MGALKRLLCFVLLFAVIAVVPLSAQAKRYRHVNAPQPAAEKTAAPAAPVPENAVAPASTDTASHPGTAPAHAGADTEAGVDPEAAHDAAATHGEGSDGLPQMNVARFPGQIFWLVITFVLTYLLMRFVTLPQVQVVVEGREKKIADDIALAKKKNEEAKKLATSYEATLKTAREDALRTTREATEASSRKTADATATQSRSLAAKLSGAEAAIASKKAEAEAALAVEAVAVVAALVQRVAGLSPKQDAVENALKQAKGA